MKKLIFLFLFFPAVSHSEGTLIPRHKDPDVQMEFENIYQRFESLHSVIVSTSVSSVNFPATTAYGDLCSVQLSAGHWFLTAKIGASVGDNNVTNTLFGVSSTAGNSSAGLTEGLTYLSFFPPVSTAASGGALPDVEITILTATTYYLKYRSAYTGLTPSASGSMIAIKL